MTQSHVRWILSPVLGFSVSSGGLFQACDLAMQWGIGLWAYGSLLVVGPLNHQSIYRLRGVDYIRHPREEMKRLSLDSDLFITSPS